MTNQRKTILVIGGAGYIGSHVVKILHQSGYLPITLDNLSTGNAKAVTRGVLIEGNMADSQLLNKIFQSHPVVAVMHFAACIDVGESVMNPEKYYVNNVSNTLNLLHVMRTYQVNTFIFSSSAAIFGLPIQDRISEFHPCNPINPYGKSKWMVENILKDYDHAYGLRYCCLRYFNAAGGDPDREIANCKTKESNLIPIVLRSLKFGDGSVKINGTDYATPDGTCIRDYIHIVDLAHAHIAALDYLLNGQPSCCFNLGNGKGFSVREVIRAAEQITHRKPHIIEGPRRPGDPPVLLADGSLAKEKLGWFPQYPDLTTMIQHAWQAL